MQEVFSKIIEKLEEIRVKKTCNKEKCDTKELCRICVVDDAIEIVKQEAEQCNNGWIPVKTRPMAKEECEYIEDCVYGESFMYECKLPDDNQEVLICTKYGTIRQTTFYTDMGCYFENYEDDGEVTAWMPLPEPYQPKGE